MDQLGTNVKKLLPSLALGVCITLLAALFNYVIYERRIPAMVAGNRILGNDADGDVRDRRPRTVLAAGMRILAGLINISDNAAGDLMRFIRGPGNFPPTRDQIAVVAIDEASIMRRGAWPWPRTDVARLVDKVSEAKVVGLDLLFGEADQTSLVNYAGRLAELAGVRLNLDGVPPEELDNDLRLAGSIAQAKTVLGAILVEGGEPPAYKSWRLIADYTLKIATRGGKEVSARDVLLRRAAYLLADIPTLRYTTPPPVGEGFMNLFPAPDGMVRSVPLFAQVPDQAFSPTLVQARRIYPSIALEVMRVALGGDSYHLTLRGDVVNIPEYRSGSNSGDRYTVKSVAVVDSAAGGKVLLNVPLNELGEMEAGFRHRRSDFRAYPAWEVLAGKHDGAFKDKLVLIGGTVPGVGYMVSTGLPNPESSVVEAHAAMLSTMLKGDFVDSGYQDEYSWQQIIILASGLAVTLAIIFGNLGIGMIVSGLTLLGIVFGNYYLFFKRGVEVGMTLPLLSTMAVLVVQAVANYLLVGRERRFIRKAFSLNVSPSILGYLETHPDRLSSLQGEHRDMTVLFTDIRGFTSISERMTAPDLARFLNEYFTPMSDIVMKNTGTVDKFIGDGLMAFWNAPTDNPTHARDAARAALDMRAKLQELQPGWTNRGLPRVNIGCGINTGPMFAGYMGSEQRKNYTVMGDNVNIASRLEDLNKVYTTGVLISENTRKELGNDFVCRVVDKVRVSGKQSAVVIYELLGVGPIGAEEGEEIAAFARVFELYQMREFATAESLLKELVFIRPTPLYKLYLDRLAIYKALPPPPDWDGTFAMTHK